MKWAMRYRNKRPSKRYRNKSPYIPRNRRYVPNLGKGGGYSGSRPYSRSNFRYEAKPTSSSAESNSYKTPSEHYQLPTRERYDPDIQRVILELNQLRNQKAFEQNPEKSTEKTANPEVGPQGILLREMLDEQAGSRKDFDTIERADAGFGKSAEDEQARIESFTQWISEVTKQPHPESLYFDAEPIESVQFPKIEFEPNRSTVEQTPALEIPNADLDILVSELYANPLETKKEVRPEIEQAESGNVY